MELAPGLRETIVNVSSETTFTPSLRAGWAGAAAFHPPGKCPALHLSHYIAVELGENPSDSQTTEVPTCKIHGVRLADHPRLTGQVCIHLLI